MRHDFFYMNVYHSLGAVWVGTAHHGTRKTARQRAEVVTNATLGLVKRVYALRVYPKRVSFSEDAVARNLRPALRNPISDMGREELIRYATLLPDYSCPSEQLTASYGRSMPGGTTGYEGTARGGRATDGGARGGRAGPEGMAAALPWSMER